MSFLRIIGSEVGITYVCEFAPRFVTNCLLLSMQIALNLLFSTQPWDFYDCRALSAYQLSQPNNFQMTNTFSPIAIMCLTYPRSVVEIVALLQISHDSRLSCDCWWTWHVKISFEFNRIREIHIWFDWICRSCSEKIEYCVNAFELIQLRTQPWFT